MKDQWGETEIKTCFKIPRVFSGGFSREVFEKAKSPLAVQKIAARPWPSGQEVTCREAQKLHPEQNKNASFSRNGSYHTKI